LPSARYLAGPHDVPAGALALPWAEDRREVVGEFARVQGARVPGRLVTSAKSWLAHAGVDRSAAILPWGAPEEVVRLSPVAVSARYVGHLRALWDAAHPGEPLHARTSCSPPGVVRRGRARAHGRRCAERLDD
jgi:hypothetical protein